MFAVDQAVAAAGTMMGDALECPEELRQRITAQWQMMCSVGRWGERRGDVVCMDAGVLALIVSEYQRDCEMIPGNGET